MFKRDGLSERCLANSPIAMDEHVPTGLNKRAADIFENFVSAAQELGTAYRCCGREQLWKGVLERNSIDAFNCHASTSKENQSNQAWLRYTFPPLRAAITPVGTVKSRTTSRE